MAGNEVKLTFAGDAKSLTTTFDKVGQGAKEMAGDLDTAETKARSFGGAMDSAGGAADASESKFMGAADLLDGLGGAFGLPTEGATGLMRAFGDLSGGFAILQPLLGTMTAGMKSFAMSLLAPPMGIVIGIGLLVGALILAYQKSETFRDIVNGVFSVVKQGVGDALGFIIDRISDLIGAAATVAEKIPGLGGIAESLRGAQDRLSGMADTMKRMGDETERTTGKTTAYKGALEGLNRVPIHAGAPIQNVGGIVRARQRGGPVAAGAPYLVGEAGPELFIPGRSGTVAPNGGGGSPTYITFNVGVMTPDLADEIQAILLRKKAVAGPLGLG